MLALQKALPGSPGAASAAVGRHSIAEVRRRRLGCQHRDRLGERHDALVVLAEGADRDSALLRLALADDEQVRNLGEAVLAHLIVDLLVAQVALEIGRASCRARGCPYV